MLEINEKLGHEFESEKEGCLEKLERAIGRGEMM